MRSLIIISLGLLFVARIYAQESELSDFQKWELRSDSLYYANKYKAFKSFADSLNDLGVVYPALNYRLGIVNFRLNNSAAALSSFDKVLDMNSDYKDAGYYSYLCNLYLNRSELAASLDFKGRGDSLMQSSFIPITGFELENSTKFSDTSARGIANYTRFGLASKISDNFSLKQSFVFYRHNLIVPMPDLNSGLYIDKKVAVKELEYYGKLSYTIPQGWTGAFAYHYLGITFDGIQSTNNLYYFSIKKYFNYCDFKINYSFGDINFENIKQFAAEVSVYPLGNLDLYYCAKVSKLKSKTTNLFNNSHTIGFKALKDLWIETFGIFGKINRYSDDDALYVYNSLDPSRYIVGGALIYTLTPQLTCRLGYNYEPKLIDYINTKYVQHSISGEIKWSL